MTTLMVNIIRTLIGFNDLYKKPFRFSIALLIVCTGLRVPAVAQVPDSTRNAARDNNVRRIPDSSRTFIPRRTLSSPSDAAIEEKLVQLALKGPRVAIAEHQSKIYEYQLKGAKNNWLNLLAVSANINDQQFNQNATYVYPKYIFGVTVPLGTFLSRTEVKAAAEGVEIGKNTQEQLRRDIRAEVVSRYRQYKAYDNLIDIQYELVNDIQAALLQTEEKFRQGTINADVYTTAQKAKNDEQARLVNLQMQQEQIKVELEKMIGTSLESVIR